MRAEATGPAQPLASAPGPRVLYILGAGRSGSTLLERVLGQSPHLTGVGELSMLWQHGVLGGRLCACGEPILRCSFWSQVDEAAPGLFSEDVAREMVEAQQRTLRTAQLHRLLTPAGRAKVQDQLPDRYLQRVEELYRAIASAAGSEVIVDSNKHPVTGWLLGQIDSLDTTYVHIVRDPRGTAYSWSRHRPEPGAPGTEMNRYSPASAATQWLLWNAASLSVSKGQPTIRVRYEDLAVHPRREVDRILEQMELPPLPAATFGDGRATLHEGHGVSGNPMRFATGSVAVSLDDEWLRSMTRLSRATVTALALPLLGAFGYRLRGPAPTKDHPGVAGGGPARPLRATLIAHTTQYRHAALALHRSGHLLRFVTLPMLRRRLPVVAPLESLINRTNDRRVFPSLHGVPMRRMWAAAAFAALSRTAAGTGWTERWNVAENRAWDLDARAKVGRPDIIHAVDGIALTTAARARQRGAFVISDLRAAHPVAGDQAVQDRLDEREAALQDRQYELSDLLICNSEYTRGTYLQAGYDPAALVVVPLGADIDLFHPAEAAPERFTVLFVGRFERAKGSAEFAVACEALSSSSRVVVVGASDPTERALMANVAAEVSWVAHVPHHRLADIYRSSSVLVLPSHSDGWGMVVIEAMASGLPVIVSDHTGAAMALTEGKDGHVIAMGDAAALIERLCDLEADPVGARRMGQAARGTAQSYTWDVYRDRLVEVYGAIERGEVGRVR